MAIAFQNATSQVVGTGTSGIINVPAGVADGDMLLLAVVVKESGANPAPAGWTQAATVNGAAVQDNLTRLFYRRASSEPASYTVAMNVTYGNSSTLAMVRYTGVISSGSPLRTTGTANRTSALGTPQTSTTLTGVLATDMSVHAAGAVLASWNGADYTMAGPGGGWSDRVSSIATAADATPGVLMLDQLGSGAAPACTAAGAGAANTAWCFCALALIAEPEPSGKNVRSVNVAVSRAASW